MRIVLINGSPKVKKSASKILLADIKNDILKLNTNTATIDEIDLHHSNVSKEALNKLKNAEVWIFAYPLYVDSIPAHLLSCLIQLEQTDWQNQKYIYGIVNCGFYEGIQAEFALNILQNWCIKTGMIWGGGIGVGGGGSLEQLPSIGNGHGPKAPVEKALSIMADKVIQRKIQENNYVSVGFPRFLYKMAAQMGWRQLIKANGGKTKDLGNRPK